MTVYHQNNHTWTPDFELLSFKTVGLQLFSQIASFKESVLAFVINPAFVYCLPLYSWNTEKVVKYKHIGKLKDFSAPLIFPFLVLSQDVISCSVQGKKLFGL